MSNYLPPLPAKRQRPRWSDLAPLLKFRRGAKGRVERRLDRACTISELSEIAQRRTPRPVFEYVSGAAEDEISLGRARSAFASVEFSPRVLRDVSAVDTSTTILGQPQNLPLILAPTGFTRMMQHEGETAVARAAANRNVPYCLSTMGTTSPERVQEVAPGADNWFQLYMWRDRESAQQLLARVREARYNVLMLTVDTPVAGNRLRDVRNGLTIPPSLTPKTLFDFARHPNWWFNVLTTEPLKFAAMNEFDGTVSELASKMFDPSMALLDFNWLRDEWDGKLVVKGIQGVDDAQMVADAGADAIVVSNHGGRQLDRAPTPLELLPRVREAVGDHLEIFLDTGVMSGADVVAAVGLGADACMIGRAYLYGLMAGGQRGVERAIDIMAAETSRTMQLMGAATLDELRGTVAMRP